MPSFNPPAGSAHSQPMGTPSPGIGVAAAGVQGHGHGSKVAPNNPIAVPVSVNGNGISRPFKSVTDAAIKKENRIA